MENIPVEENLTPWIDHSNDTATPKYTSTTTTTIF